MGNPYEEGEQAFHNGAEADSNPYNPAVPAHAEWDRGYIDADAAASGERG